MWTFNKDVFTLLLLLLYSYINLLRNVVEGSIATNYTKMTTVGPLPQVNIMSKSARAPLAQPTCRQVSVVATTDVIADVNEQSNKDSEDAGFCGESFADNGELLSSLSPLLFSMKLFGLYFHRQDRRRRPTDDPEWNPVSTSTTGSAWNKLRVYATVALILAWLNAFRFVFVFTSSDYFGAMLLMKVSVISWYFLTAILQTAYYYASHTGKLLKVLLTLQVTPDCVRGARRAAVFLTASGWVTIIMNGGISIYLYLATDGTYDFNLAPMFTYIEVPENKLILARMFGCFLHSLPTPSSTLTLLMAQILVYVIYHEFRKLKKHFCRALGKRGEFSGDLSVFRRRHSLVDEENLGLRRLQQLIFIRGAPSTSPDTE